MILTIIFVSDHGVNRDTGMIIFKSVILLGWSIASIVVTSMLLVQTADYNKVMHTQDTNPNQLYDEIVSCIGDDYMQ